MSDQEINSIMSYFGLDSKDDARKVGWILEELKKYGDWGDKVSAYFSSIISGTEGTRTFIEPKLVDAYKSLFVSHGRGKQEGRS